MYRSFVLAAALLTAGMLFAPVNAQHRPADSVLQQYYRAANRTIDVVLSDFDKVLSTDERRILRNIDVLVGRRDWNIFGVRATKQGSVREIHLTMGFLIAVDYIDTAVVVREILNEDKQALIDYVGAVADAIRETMRRGRRGEPPVQIPTYDEWIGISASKWRDLVGSEQFINYKEVVKLHSFALVLGHEFAHHYEGHLENDTSSIEEELEADRRGVEIAIAADYNPILSWTPFLLFAALEGDQGIYDGTSTHPPPLCRVLFVLEEGTYQALDDDAFIDYLIQTNRYDLWMENVERLEELLRSEVTSCPT